VDTASSQTTDETPFKVEATTTIGICAAIHLFQSGLSGLKVNTHTNLSRLLQYSRSTAFHEIRGEVVIAHADSGKLFDLERLYIVAHLPIYQSLSLLLAVYITRQVFF
jgi:hypothetical protein